VITHLAVDSHLRKHIGQLELDTRVPPPPAEISALQKEKPCCQREGHLTKTSGHLVGEAS